MMGNEYMGILITDHSSGISHHRVFLKNRAGRAGGSGPGSLGSHGRAGWAGWEAGHSTHGMCLYYTPGSPRHNQVYI